MGVTHQVKQVVDSSTSSDPLLNPSGPITRALVKRFKKPLNLLIKDISAKQIGQESTIVKNNLSRL